MAFNCTDSYITCSVTIGDVTVAGLLVVCMIVIFFLVTRRIHLVVQATVRKELSRFLYSRQGDIVITRSNKSVVKKVKNESKTGSLSSVLRTLTKAPGIYCPEGQGYSRMDLDEESLSSFSTRNSYDAKSLTV